MRLAEWIALIVRPHTLAKNVPRRLARSCSLVLFSARFGYFRLLFDFVLQRNVAKHLHNAWRFCIGHITILLDDRLVDVDL
jgi:hypothetical protein